MDLIVEEILDDQILVVAAQKDQQCTKQCVVTVESHAKCLLSLPMANLSIVVTVLKPMVAVQTIDVQILAALADQILTINKCLMQSATSVEKIAKYLLNPEMANQYTAAIV